MKTLSTPELAQRVAQELSTPEPQARAVIDRTIEVMKKELQRGNRIELPEFLTVHVKQGVPVAAKTAADANIRLPASRLIQMDLDDQLRSLIEGTGRFQMLMVVPRKNFFTDVMAARLQSERSQVTVVEKEEAALEFLKKTIDDGCSGVLTLTDTNGARNAIKA